MLDYDEKATYYSGQRKLIINDRQGWFQLFLTKFPSISTKSNILDNFIDTFFERHFSMTQPLLLKACKAKLRTLVVGLSHFSFSTAEVTNTPRTKTWICLPTNIFLSSKTRTAFRMAEEWISPLYRKGHMGYLSLKFFSHLLGFDTPYVHKQRENSILS